MSNYNSQEGDRFRKTVFCSNNPNKELNPPRHITKRPMDKILQQLNQNDISLSKSSIQKPTIMNVNQQTYCYNKEIKQPVNVEINSKKIVGKKLYEDKLKENIGKNIIVSPPINTEQLNVRKASGQYYQGKNTQSQNVQQHYPNAPRQLECKKKQFESKKLNKETITTELTDQINHHDKYRSQSISQRRQIPQKTTIQDCFNDFPNQNKVQSQRNSSQQPQYNSTTTTRGQRSTTTHDSFSAGVQYNKPFVPSNQQNLVRKTNAYYKYGTSTTTHSSFYL
ncbi:hypothetical protein TTHERM_00581580 (macronuclear) [Tetrahymena thermophila SB210]|uniref:Uncharacterized protein n=1 Tax=Tetrahymena thermophila (strain SB210) TaxID=312017 RepID=Q23QC8_TETTS|nr:hypothetical protein TTHERM_00581580 [Tetrahymena thermophila SB210]EAR98656.1 hypothetical protein TTHERM_00581580 [Tetrahymena thermophila SB210]|eukprot:XP_001018901.1 hypothetical protein TTHERM_00581580 [Tetrahymena thermophila SB210]